MLLKINYYNKFKTRYSSYYKTVYRSVLYSEFFYRLKLPYLRFFARRIKLFNIKYKKKLKKRYKNKQNYVEKSIKVIKRKNRGSKIKGYFFKKKTKKKISSRNKWKKKLSVTTKDTKKKFFKYYRFF